MFISLLPAFIRGLSTIVHMHYKVYKNKTASNAVDFLEACKSCFPFISVMY